MLKNITKISLILIILLNSTIVLNAAEEASIFEIANEQGEFYGEAYLAIGNDNGYDVKLDEGYTGYLTDQKLSNETIFNIGSISKIFTTVGILTLEQENKLDIDDTIDMYLEDVPEDKKEITIEMLLTHTSGITVEERYESYSKDEVFDYIMDASLSYEPGEVYSYSNSGFSLLAMIIESASNQTYEDYITETIIEPLNLTSTGFPGDEDLNYENGVIGVSDETNNGNMIDYPYGWESTGYTDILSTAEDLTTFVQSIAQGEILNEQSIEEMTTPYINSVDGEEVYRGLGIQIYYDEDDNPTYFHSGSWYGGNSFFSYRPADKLSSALFTNDIYFGYYYPATTLGTEFLETPLNYYDEYDTIETYELKQEVSTPENTVPTTSETIAKESNTLLITIIFFLIIGIIVLLIILLIRRNNRRKKDNSPIRRR